jgi:4'-phosphopantetheinyl transferase
MRQSYVSSENLSFSSWLTPSGNLVLKNDEIHVWRANLDKEEGRIQYLSQILSSDELERAERFHFRKDRNHFIVSRGMLRIILGRYLKREAGQLHFRYNKYGKPELADETGERALRFNVSHSHGVALNALTYDRDIGVDIEYIRPDIADEEISGRFFSSKEIAELCSLPVHIRKDAFFACWTRKEAYIKARGDGLSMPLDQFDVTVIPGKQAALLSVYGDKQEASRWSLEDLNLGQGYAAALAAKGHDWYLKCWQWAE